MKSFQIRSDRFINTYCSNCQFILIFERLKLKLALFNIGFWPFFLLDWHISPALLSLSVPPFLPLYIHFGHVTLVLTAAIFRTFISIKCQQQRSLKQKCYIQNHYTAFHLRRATLGNWNHGIWSFPTTWSHLISQESDSKPWRQQWQK